LKQLGMEIDMPIYQTVNPKPGTRNPKTLNSKSELETKISKL